MMFTIKKIGLLICFLLFFSTTGLATNYYISSSGRDSNNGLSPATPWQTITKLNVSFSIIQPGDSILFKRGDRFFGAIVVAVSGKEDSPIVFSAYGKGHNPVITGFATIRGWKNLNGNIWEAPAPGIKNNVNMVAIDGVPQRIGRYPNADAPDGGYLRFQNKTAANNIIDSSLSNTIDWTGAEIVVRKNHWTAERCRITEHAGKRLRFTYALPSINNSLPPRLYDGVKGNGYFIQKSQHTLDQQGEWFLDSTNGTLQVFLADTGHIVKAAAIDTLINTAGKSYLLFSQLDIEGSNISGIYNRDGEHITVKDCRFSNIGCKAIQFWATGNVLIEKVHTNHILSNAIQVRSTRKNNVTISNCHIKNTGMFIGMGSFFDDRDYKAVSVNALNNLLVQGNTIDSTGLTGIQFQGNNVVVQHNLINHYCLLLDDGAGIYSFVDFSEENAGEQYINRVVKNNIILNGRGAPEGSIKSFKAEGIYLDGRTMNVEVVGNSIAYVGNKALTCNNPENILLRDNTCFNNGGGWGANRTITWKDMKGLQVKHNIFYQLGGQQSLVNFNHSGLDVPEKVSVWEAIRLMGEVDSNYYSAINPLGFVYNFAPEAGKPMLYPSPLTFENWREFTGQDIHSTLPVKQLPRYLLKNNIGNNLVNNGGFDNGMEAVNVFGSGAKGYWDNSGKVNGKGSLKIDCGLPQSNRYVLIHGEVGALQAGKNYLLQFTTLGTSECGIARAYLRKTTAPYTAGTAIQVQPFGTAKKQHSFLLSPQVSEKMSFVIEVEKNSCTTYIDDISLLQADAKPVDDNSRVLFEYNATDKPVVIKLSKKYTGVDGSRYADVLALQPFTSIVLIEDIVD